MLYILPGLFTQKLLHLKQVIVYPIPCERFLHEYALLSSAQLQV